MSSLLSPQTSVPLTKESMLESQLKLKVLLLKEEKGDAKLYVEHSVFIYLWKVKTELANM
jgi:hypothetical protein